VQFGGYLSVSEELAASIIRKQERLKKGAAVSSETLTRRFIYCIRVHGVTSKVCLCFDITSASDVFVLSHLILKLILDAKNAYINCMYAKLCSCGSFGADCISLIGELIGEGLRV
jgi:hypothetical protein